MVVLRPTSRPFVRSTNIERWVTRLFWGLAALIPLVFVSVFFVWPVLTMVAVGFDSGFGAAFSEVFGRERTWRVLQQTLNQAVSATALSLLLGVPAAFVLYRLQFVGRTLLRGITAVPFVLPTVVVAVAFVALFGPDSALSWVNLDRSFLVLVLALTFFNVTVVARIVGSFWQQLDPRREHAARVLGASPVRVWFTVTTPALAPAIISAAVLVFLFCATSFGVVLILGGREFANIETEIYRLTVNYLDLGSAAVLSLVQFVMIAVVLVVASRMRTRNERAAQTRLADSRGQRPNRSHAPVIVVFAATLLLLHILPIGALVLRSLRDPAGNVSLVNYVHLFQPPESVRLPVSVATATLNSIQFAAVATVLAISLSILVALVASRRPRFKLGRRAVLVFDAVIMLPLGVSAVTVGFGLLLTMHNPLGLGVDLRSSHLLIIAAQTLIALPLVVRALLPALRSISSRQYESAAMLGASPFRVLRTIDLPILVKSLGVATGLAFATALGEFGATAFLVRPDSETLPVVISQLIGRQGAEHYGMALAASVLLALITATIMLSAEGAQRKKVAHS